MDRRIVLVLVPVCIAAFAGTWLGLMAEDSGAAPSGSSFLLAAGAGSLAGGVLLPLTASRRLPSGVLLALLGVAALLAYAGVRTGGPGYVAAAALFAAVALALLLAALIQTTVRVDGSADIRQQSDVAFVALADPRHPAGRSRRAGQVELNGALAAGTGFRIEVNPGERDHWAAGEIREYEPGRRVVYHVVLRGVVLPTTTGYELESTAAGTHVTAWIEARSPWLTAWLARRALAEHLAEILAAMENDIG